MNKVISFNIPFEQDSLKFLNLKENIIKEELSLNETEGLEFILL